MVCTSCKTPSPTQKKLQDVQARFAAKYGYLSAEEVESIYRLALGVYLATLYPYEPSRTEFPEDRARDVYWIELAMQQIVERSGASSAVAYSENGLSIQFDSSFLVSKDLRRLITPNVGVPK